LLLNIFAPGLIQAVRKKNSWIARGFAREFLWSGKRYRPGQKLERLGKSCSLYSKTIFGWGCGFFVSDIISGGRLGHLGQLHLALGPNR